MARYVLVPKLGREIEIRLCIKFWYILVVFKLQIWKNVVFF